MCINPAQHDGKTFACRKCWQCNENRIQDWVGRCVAQTKTSTRAYYGTLTYGGGDNERATVLTYSDVQKFFKRLRAAKYRFRYLVAGEYGGANRRAHWHVILFFEGKVPDIALRKDYYTFDFWRHGYSYWDDVNPKSARYVCKYIRKDDDDEEAQAHFAMSKKPPIGTEYFERLAKWHVENGVPPTDLIYTFDENRDKNGKRIKHYMHGATARDFLQAYLDKGGKYGGDDGITSTLVEEFVDKQGRYAPDPHLIKRSIMPKPAWLPKNGCILKQEDNRNAYTTEINGERYFWREQEGQFRWQNAKGTRVIHFEASDRYQHLKRQADLRMQRDRQSETPRPTGATRSERQTRSANRRRLPMVGDGW